MLHSRHVAQPPPFPGRPEEHLSPRLHAAHEKALKILSAPGNCVKEQDFVTAGVYSRETVMADLRNVLRLQKEWKAKTSPKERVTNSIAEILEAMILQEGEMSGWLGDATTTRASMHDDYVNKTDLFAEWYSADEGSRILSLAIDVTFGQETPGRKLSAIRDEIDRGTLGTVKYFMDARGDFMGTRRNVPRVVIGVSKVAIEELSVLWINNKRTELGAHGIQRALIEEIRMQLQAMHDYAEARGQHSIAEAYTAPLSIINKLLVEKRKLSYGSLKDDPVFLEILDQTARIFSK